MEPENDNIGRAVNSLCNLDTTLADRKSRRIKHQKAHPGIAVNSDIPELAKWDDKASVLLANSKRALSKLSDEGVATVEERLIGNRWTPEEVYSLIEWVKEGPREHHGAVSQTAVRGGGYQEEQTERQSLYQSVDKSTQLPSGSMSHPRAGRSRSRRSGALNSLLQPWSAAQSRARSAISNWHRKKHLYTAANSVIGYARARSRFDTMLSCQRPEGALMKEENAAHEALVSAARDVRVMTADGTKYHTLARRVIELDKRKVVENVWTSMVDVTGVRSVAYLNARDRGEVPGFGL